jgi:hypothetical protein
LDDKACLTLFTKYERSLKKYPNIKLGEDFQGYPKK